MKSLSRVRLFATPRTAFQAPPSMGFSRQEYWGGLPFSSPGDLPNPGIKLRSPAVQTDALPFEPPEKPYWGLGTKYHVGLSHCGSIIVRNFWHRKVSSVFYRSGGWKWKVKLLFKLQKNLVVELVCKPQEVGREGRKAWRKERERMKEMWEGKEERERERRETGGREGQKAKGVEANCPGGKALLNAA